MFRWLSVIIASLLSIFSNESIYAIGAERNDNYGAATLVVYNQNVKDSRRLAAYYAKARNIPFENLVATKCPTSESITRSDFEDSILDPLRDLFIDNQWWVFSQENDSKKEFKKVR